MVLVSSPDLAPEVVDALEALVDAGEPQVGDLVDHPEVLEHRQTHLLRRGLPALVTQLVLDLTGDDVELLLGHRTVLGGRPQPVDQLAPVERLAQARALDHDQRDLVDPLEGGVAVPAAGAFPAAPDGGPVLGHPRVHDPIVVGQAPGTTHASEASALGLASQGAGPWIRAIHPWSAGPRHQVRISRPSVVRVRLRGG